MRPMASFALPLVCSAAALLFSVPDMGTSSRRTGSVVTPRLLTSGARKRSDLQRPPAAGPGPAAGLDRGRAPGAAPPRGDLRGAGEVRRRVRFPGARPFPQHHQGHGPRRGEEFEEAVRAQRARPGEDLPRLRRFPGGGGGERRREDVGRRRPEARVHLTGPRQDGAAFLKVKGVRDIATGLVILALLITGPRRALGWAIRRSSSPPPVTC
ncbi:DUF4267 domain-containing protein [Streptomyces sp. NPDC029003]|uniref:DUF4267 domain-containing protein n=1 Tax=Streptomyces sp. NPDC029003 TaxID=3155125 RepID=UPI0033C375F1